MKGWTKLGDILAKVCNLCCFYSPAQEDRLFANITFIHKSGLEITLMTANDTFDSHLVSGCL